MNLQTETLAKNWETCTSPEVLNKIQDKDVNIAIFNREIGQLKNEIKHLLELNIEVRTSGDIDSILDSISQIIDPKDFGLIIQDIHELLKLFKNASEANSFRLLLATVNNNMCRRFHTDINDLRMLCTYDGPGTLWLTEDNIERNALNSRGDNECIVLDGSNIQQAKTGAVVILKGAMYPAKGTNAVVHRSPTIEESGETRLLLRIDTNEFLNFI